MRCNKPTLKQFSVIFPNLNGDEKNPSIKVLLPSPFCSTITQVGLQAVAPRHVLHEATGQQSAPQQSLGLGIRPFETIQKKYRQGPIPSEDGLGIGSSNYGAWTSDFSTNPCPLLWFEQASCAGVGSSKWKMEGGPTRLEPDPSASFCNPNPLAIQGRCVSLLNIY